MQKIIVYIATSEVAWLDRPRSAGDYGMAAFYKSIDTVLMGRKTYEIAVKLGQTSYPGKKNYIFSRAPRRGRFHFELGQCARSPEGAPRPPSGRFGSVNSSSRKAVMFFISVRTVILTRWAGGA